MSANQPSVAAAPLVDAAWPPLPLEAWKDTRDTLHMYTQIVGKVRLALAPIEPQWNHVPLYLTSRGLTTSPVPYRGCTFSIDFDLLAHRLDITRSDGATHGFSLGPRPVARFYDEVMAALRSLHIEVEYRARPVEVVNTIPFPEDLVHASYEPEYVERFFRILSQVDVALKRHRGRFLGRASQVAFFWGTFDLAYSRYSGRPAAPPPGSDIIYRLGMNVETIEAGFWPGDERFPEPAFYCFTYPKPSGIERAPLQPREAFWSEKMGEFLLRYEDVRRAESPVDAILAFFESGYRAGATLGGWDAPTLEAPAALAA